MAAENWGSLNTRFLVSLAEKSALQVQEPALN